PKENASKAFVGASPPRVQIPPPPPCDSRTRGSRGSGYFVAQPSCCTPGRDAGVGSDLHGLPGWWRREPWGMTTTQIIVLVVVIVVVLALIGLALAVARRKRAEHKREQAQELREQAALQAEEVLDRERHAQQTEAEAQEARARAQAAAADAERREAEASRIQHDAQARRDELGSTLEEAERLDPDGGTDPHLDGRPVGRHEGPVDGDDRARVEAPDEDGRHRA